MSFIARLIVLRLLWQRLRHDDANESGAPAEAERTETEKPRPTRDRRPRDGSSAKERGAGRIVSPDAPLTSTPVASAAGPGPDSPLELGAGDWPAVAKRTAKEIKNDRVPFTAAAMAYYAFLAIFPSLIALVGILGLVQVDASGLIDSLRTNLPAGAGDTLATAVENADDPSESASLLAAALGIAAAVWSGSSGMVALQTGLNIAYDVDDDRAFLGKRGVALSFLVAILVLGGVPSPFFAFGDSTLMTAIGWLCTLAAVLLLFSLFYYFGPNKPSKTWKWVTAGSVLGAFLWITASVGFSLYIDNFSSYGKTYGELAGVIVLILWLYISALAVLVGGELNAEIERQAERRQDLASG